MAHQLKSREILDVGTFNGTEITGEDLDAIVENFDKLGSNHNVPLKFGHNDEQEMTDGQPAIGWITKVFRQGNKLFADFSNMPRTVFEAIKNKLYRTVSVELLFNVDNDGNKFNLVLDAVALLGADHPAVKSLADLDALMASRTDFTGGRRVAFETIAGTTKKIKHTSEVHMDKKEVQELIDQTTAPLIASNAELTKKLDEANAANAKFTQEKADGEKATLEEKVKLARKAVTDHLDAAIRAKSLTPAIRETYEKQIGLSDDSRVLEIKLDEVKAMFTAPDEQKPTGLEKNGDDEIDEKNPGDQLLALTHKDRQPNESFQAAFSRTSAANPKLHQAYLDSNGEK